MSGITNKLVVLRKTARAPHRAELNQQHHILVLLMPLFRPLEEELKAVHCFGGTLAFVSHADQSQHLVNMCKHDAEVSKAVQGCCQQ